MGLQSNYALSIVYETNEGVLVACYVVEHKLGSAKGQTEPYAYAPISPSAYVAWLCNLVPLLKNNQH